MNWPLDWDGRVLRYVDALGVHSLYTQVSNPLQIFPNHRSGSRRVGPGVEMRADPVERRRRSGQELDAYTSLE